MGRTVTWRVLRKASRINTVTAETDSGAALLPHQHQEAPNPLTADCSGVGLPGAPGQGALGPGPDAGVLSRLRDLNLKNDPALTLHPELT